MSFSIILRLSSYLWSLRVRVFLFTENCKDQVHTLDCTQKIMDSIYYLQVENMCFMTHLGATKFWITCKYAEEGSVK